MKALIFEQFGGPEVLHYTEVPEPELLPSTVLLRMKAVGLNFADMYRRRGNYHLAGKPPYILGYEGAGVVEQVASDVTRFKPGDRVAFADVPYANAELVQVPIEKAIPLPEGISYEIAASVLLQGMTAHYLTRDSYLLRPGDEVLVHAASGGVGQLLTQLAKLSGSRVLGLTSSQAKREVALAAGADEVLLYDSNWVEAAKRWSGEGNGLTVAYDSVGSTLMDSFAAVRTKGTVVFYGMAGGDPAWVDPRMLMDTSKTLTGGDLWNHVTTLADRVRRADELFRWIQEGHIRLEPPKAYPLREGAEAHRLMESRRSTGKIILIP